MLTNRNETQKTNKTNILYYINRNEIQKLVKSAYFNILWTDVYVVISLELQLIKKKEYSY